MHVDVCDTLPSPQHERLGVRGAPRAPGTPTGFAAASPALGGAAALCQLFWYVWQRKLIVALVGACFYCLDCRASRPWSPGIQEQGGGAAVPQPDGTVNARGPDDA